MKKNLAVFLLFNFIATFLFAVEYGKVRGKITDPKGEVLSFVSVYVKGTQIGTTCSEEGIYELKLSAGQHELVFYYIGYKQQSQTVNIAAGQTTSMDIKLEPSTYDLFEVTIKATAEDPAYPIMRQAIARRRLYLNEAKEYQCKVYMKGLQRLTRIPKRVMLIKVPEDIKPGIVYLSESLSELSFQQPDKIKERMISSKVSGDNQAFSYNQAAVLQFTLYDNIVPSFGLNQRGFVSPLAWNAMMYYKYKLIGESKENGFTIFKIQLIPMRKNDPVFKGYIYIVKDSWRIQGTDLLLDKDANIEFVDTCYIKQTYVRQPGGVWMPTAQRLIFQLGILGFRGNGYFVSIYSDYKVNSIYPPAFYEKENTAIAENVATPQVRKVKTIDPKKVIRGEDNRKEKKKEKNLPKDSTTLFTENYFSKEIMTVDKKANKTDDSSWAALRPIPLSEEEVADYHQKDSVYEVENSKAYMDSMDKRRNKIDWSSFLISGWGISKSYERQYFYVDPLIALVQYNTVEGWVINERISFSKRHTDETFYSLSQRLRYGVASRKFYAEGRVRYQYDPVKESTISLGGGLFVEQYNAEEPISTEVNSAYTLFAEQNYLKEYQKGYIRPSFRSEIANGVDLLTSLEFSNRVSLENARQLTFRNFEGRSFTTNIPVNKELANTYFTPNQALLLDVQFQFTFGQLYAIRPNEKIRYGSKYPKLNVHYTKGIPGVSDVNFDELSVWVKDGIGFNLMGRFHYHVVAGGFLNATKLYFPDYHHFKGNRTSLASSRYSGYQLLDYYYYSTKGSYLEVHLDHHFNGFIFNKIPLIRKLKWQEVATMNYLKTTSLPDYMELGVGIEHIFKLFRIDYFRSVQKISNASLHGIRIGFGF